MSNEQMKPNRFWNWFRARRTVANIRQHLSNGGTVIISTYTHHTKFTSKHSEMFKATKSGAYMQRGKHWDCIDHCAIRYY